MEPVDSNFNILISKMFLSRDEHNQENLRASIEAGLRQQVFYRDSR